MLSILGELQITSMWYSLQVWNYLLCYFVTISSHVVEALFLLTGVSCVGVMGNRRITCFFIVEKLFCCGAWFSDLLGFLGFCLDRLLTLFAAGGTGSENTLLGFGI